MGREGATVIISSRKQENVDAALEKLKKEGIDAHGQVCHVGKKKQRKAYIAWVAEKFGKIDILSWNAGVGFYAG